jgi:hypothetical protein
MKVTSSALTRAVAVVAIGGIAIGCGGSSNASLPTTTAPPPSSASPSASAIVLTPVDVTASTSFTPFGVALMWIEPAGGAGVTRFEVRREGELVADLGATSVTTTDHDVEPGKTYTYTVVAISGDERSAEATIEVTVPVPPIEEARVDGHYFVTTKATSHSGFQTFNAKPKFDWYVDPKCHDGACDVVVEIQGGVRKFTLTLHRDGDHYTGTKTGKLNAYCGTVLLSSTVEIDVRVVKAGPLAYPPDITKDWIASKLTGQMMQTEAAQLGCSGSEATYDLTAKT